MGRNHNLLFRIIAWSLVTAVFALTVQPLHVHLQHTDDASSVIHDHVVDLHAEVDNIAPAGEEEGTVFPVTPDVLLKKLGDNLLTAAIIVSLYVILFSIAYTNSRRPTVLVIQPAPRWFCIAPPLRAPPLP